MLKTILMISGRPGLYKLVSRSKNALIVESLADGKRIPSYNNEKAMSLNDIAIYTTEEEKPLREVFATIFAKEEGKSVKIDTKSGASGLRSYFEQILPNYDVERVYPNDIKKIIVWYNLLVGAGVTSFEESAEEVIEE